MRLKPDLLLNFTFILSLSLLLTLSLLSYQGTQQYITYSIEVNHTQQIMSEIENVISLMKDAETGQRGFLLTHDSVFLEPYHMALVKITPTFQRMSKLINNPVQTLRMDTLKQLVNERTQILKSVLNSPSSYKYDYAENKDVLYKGKKKMDELRQLINRMKESEAALLVERDLQENRSRNVVSIYTVVIGFCALTLLTGYFIWVQREFQHRMKIQHTLKEKVEALNQSNAELEQFAYVASHDLQEPIRKIQAFSSQLLLKYKVDLPQEVQIRLEKINDSAQRMQMLINDLLSLSRLVNKMEVAEITDLNKIIELVKEDLSEVIREKGAIIQSDVLPKLGAIPSQMRQLLQNLISNALKFSKNGVKPEIKIKAETVKSSEITELKTERKSNYYHKISIEDNGIGFDEKYLEKIFIIFQRLHNHTEYGGTGIGLAICKRIVTNHEGYITARGEPEKGATFVIYLPKSV